MFRSGANLLQDHSLTVGTEDMVAVTLRCFRFHRRRCAALREAGGPVQKDTSRGLAREKLLILHVGLRKTGSTFLQTRVFIPSSPPKPSDPLLYVPGTREGSLAQQLIRGGGTPAALRSFVHKVSREIESREGCRAVIVSSEDLLLDRGRGSNLGERLRRGEHKARQLRELPLLTKLAELKRDALELQMGVRLLIGIRRQDEILAAEYAQQSAAMLTPSQKSFEATVSEFLEQRDDSLEYSNIFDAVASLLGVENVMMYDTPTLSDEEILTRIRRFCGLPEGFASRQIPTVNSHRVNDSVWQLRGFLGLTNHLKSVWPLHKRGSVFSFLRLILNVIDSFVRLLAPKPGEIQLPADLSRRVLKRYSLNNQRLKELKTQHPEQVFLGADNWFDLRSR